jgi:CRISPR-associated protein Cas6
VDHAWALRDALVSMLPWLGDEPGAGIHSLHVADSGNGWQRPDNPDDLLYPSRRTRLSLRLPRSRVTDAEKLKGATLDIAGNPLIVEQASVRGLSDLTTLFSRYVVAGEGEDEAAFLAEALRRLQAMGIRPRKMICGIERHLGTPEGRIRTRSLMLAELAVDESVRLQQQGLGPHRLLGCGLFIPHKGIQEIGASRE